MYAEFAALYSKIFPLNPAQLEFVRRHLGERGSLLDLGCGTGVLCHALLGEGHDCLGIDLDPAMIEWAKRRGAQSKFKVMAVEDMGDIGREFDVAVCLGNVISHLDASALSRTHEGVSRVIKPGGKWICQLVNWNIWITSRAWKFPVIERDAGRLRFHREYRGDEHTVEFTVRLEMDGQEVHRGTSTLFPRPVESHVEIACSHGCELDAALGGWDGRRFDSGRDESVILTFSRPPRR